MKRHRLLLGGALAMLLCSAFAWWWTQFAIELEMVACVATEADGQRPGLHQITDETLRSLRGSRRCQASAKASRHRYDFELYYGAEDRWRVHVHRASQELTQLDPWITNRIKGYAFGDWPTAVAV